ncbi:hypothetical protein Pmani_027370 [Petrolisthes manimaculis]|uniref:C2H2-type domain-containing protein n=1 Tax=Petrolisthes manimaculis TaxID=1843537 RepID=A0AAE1P1S0_9EUCA|nr:hypothetical protein Pmani_028639 [Petrolisthes manimaculis]KAK4300429.1 hypothetical protein Pmani_027370 [Petrolisthes manimaculis]
MSQQDDSNLKLAGKDIGAVDGTTNKHRDPPPRAQSRTPHQLYDINTPNFTTNHQLDKFAQLLKVEGCMCDCGIKSTSRVTHMEHILTHVCSAFKCPQCNCSFTKSSVLAQHQRLVHSPDLPKQRVLDISRPISGTEKEMCNKCGTSVGHDFEVHAKTHLYGEFECPICALRMDTKPILEMHIEHKHSRLFSTFLKNEDSLRDGNSKCEKESGSPVSCDVCGKVVTIPSRLARHRYLHHPEHYPWPCPDCSLAFSSPDSLIQHICPHQQKGGGGKTGARQKYECDECGVLLKSRLNLEKHTCSHPGRTGGMHSCPICHHALASRKALTDHLRHHRRQGFSCEFCGAKLKSMDSLNVHINELHTHVVRLQCKHCPQVFFSSGRLSYHIKRHHTDRRSYTNLCHLCGKVYPYPSELRLHLRSHRNERPYKCDQCQKSFLKQGDLTYHKRSHTGERPHKCPHCLATFPRPNTLTSHIRHHHRQSITDALSTAPPPKIAPTLAAMHPGVLPPVVPPAPPSTTALDPSAPGPTATLNPSVPPPIAALNSSTPVPTVSLNNSAPPPTVAPLPTVALNPSAPPPTVALNPNALPPTVALNPNALPPTVALNPPTSVSTVALNHSAPPPPTDNLNPSAPQAIIAMSSTSVSTPTAPSYMAAPTATVMAISSTPYLTPMNPTGSVQPRSPAVTVMSIPGTPRHAQPTTLVPMVEGQLVDSGIEGQPMQYVQVEGLPNHTLQPLHSQQPQTQYSHTPSPLPYQIVHFQILQ